LSTIQRVAKNTGIVIGGEIICKIIALFTVIYLARYLHPVEFGKYSFVFAYLAFFGELTDLGLKSILVREMSRDKTTAPILIGNAYSLKLLLTTLAISLAVIIITLMAYPSDTTTYVYIAAFTLLFISFSDLYLTVFQANLRMEYSMISRIIYRIFFAILILWIIFAHGSLIQIMVAMVLSEAVKALINYLFSRKFVKPQFNIDFKLWKYFLKESLPLALSGFTWVVYHQTDIIMLSMMQGDASVGIYSAAHRLLEPLGFITTALMVSVFPLMSTYFINSKEKLIKSYKLSIKYLLIITLPIAIGITFIADKIILLIYGTSFAGSTTALQIIIWALVFLSVNSVLINLLVSINKQKLNTVSTVVCAIANVVLNLILIPVLSYNGAAIATVATNAVLFVACYYFVSKHLQAIPIHKMLLKPIISGIIMGTFLCCFNDINLFLLISLAAILYFAALIALKTFSEEDWNMIKKVLGRK